MKKNLNYYLSLPYTTLIEWSDKDNCFLGSIVEIEKNMTCGAITSNGLKGIRRPCKISK